MKRIIPRLQHLMKPALLLCLTCLLADPLLANESAEAQLEQARAALTGEPKDTAQAKKLLLDIVNHDKDTLDSTSLCYVYVYLGYIEDRAGNRGAAIPWYKKAIALKDTDRVRECAEYGLEEPLTWIRHLDEGAGEISLQSAPPVVVKTVPVAGVTNVDPALTEIRVTYSKPMRDGNWAWSAWSEENYPETTGKPRYLSDGRTCVLPVKLKPDKFYAIWLNSEQSKNFTDTAGRFALPYLLTFSTGAAGSSGERRLQSLVEDFFAHNYRDITARDTLAWGPVGTDEKGNATIRYRYRAKIWDKDTVTNNQVFTFNPQGKLVSARDVYGDPRERMMALVEKFFRNNFRDITSRETLEWGGVVTADNGNSSIRYKYRAKIWNKDTVTNNQVFTFDRQDEFVSVKDAATAGVPEEGASGQPASGMDPLAVRTYIVGKSVSDFPTNEDLSTPEAAYAMFNRACASGDQAVWGRLSVESIARHFPADAKPEQVPASAADKWLNAEMVEVKVYRDGFAMVFARIPSASKNIIDIRNLELQNGRWLNAGNDVAGSLEEARKLFARRCARRDAERGSTDAARH